VYDGSISTVYKARQDRLGRLVALKLLTEYPPPADVILERFNRAAYVTAQAVHSNLPVLYESGTADGYHYAALEFVTGQSAQEMVYQRGRLSERRATHIGWQVARALAALHDKGIIHRNVKPKNILVDGSGKVCLVGLGLAKCDAACFSRHLDARTIGTPHFMAPEMIRGNCTDPRSDLYSLGATLFALVAGRPPFDQGAPAAVMAKHLYEAPPSLKSLQPDLSNEFIDFVEQLMVKDPARRLGSAREAAERLENLAQRFNKERVEGWPAPGPVQTLRRRASMGPLALLIGAALMALSAGAVLCGIALWRMTGHSELPPPAPLTTPEAAPAEQMAFEQLTQREAVFATKPELGLQAWQDYLQRYPDASAERRCLGRMQVERLRERMNRAQRQGDTGRDLDF
jgi:serine/threonine-protein kinase